MKPLTHTPLTENRAERGQVIVFLKHENNRNLKCDGSFVIESSVPQTEITGPGGADDHCHLITARKLNDDGSYNFHGAEVQFRLGGWAYNLNAKATIVGEFE